MKPKTTGYSQTFPLPNGGWEKIWHEWEMDEHDDPSKALYEARKVVLGFHFESNKAEEKKQVTPQGGYFSPADQAEDLEWLTIKQKLSEIEFQEDAEAYIQTTDYSMAWEARKIIQSKPSQPQL